MATIEQLYNLYESELGRAPDPGGLAYWSGYGGSDLEQAFRNAAAGEIAARPAVSQQTIADLYQQELGRAPDEAGAQFWSTYMGQRVDPREVEAFRAAAQNEIRDRLAQATRPGVTQAEYDALMTQVQDLQNQLTTRTQPGTSSPGSGFLPGTPGINLNYTQPATGVGAELAAPAYAPPARLPSYAPRAALNVGALSKLARLRGAEAGPSELPLSETPAELLPNAPVEFATGAYTPLQEQLLRAYRPLQYGSPLESLVG